jgi:hypothetical protein
MILKSDFFFNTARQSIKVTLKGLKKFLRIFSGSLPLPPSETLPRPKAYMGGQY